MARGHMRPPLIIVPGLGDSGPDHWQSHWQRVYPASVRVAQRDWNAPDLESWLGVLAAAVERMPDAVLVGHSLGSLLIAHFAARYPRLPVAGALLVAPVDVNSGGRLPPAAADFSPLPAEPIRFPAMVMASDSDPYATIDFARTVAATWRSQFINLGACGHINVAAGFGPWPAGRRILDAFLDDITNIVGREPSNAA